MCSLFVCLFCMILTLKFDSSGSYFVVAAHKNFLEQEALFKKLKYLRVIASIQAETCLYKVIS